MTAKSNVETKSIILTKRKKLFDKSELQMNILYQEQIASISHSFCKKSDLVLGNNARILSNPFMAGVFPEFIQPNEYLKNLLQELSEIEMDRKINDLYQFEQSNDLMNCKKQNIALFLEVLKEKVLPWMKDISHIDLSDNISLFCSCYTHTDHLLCHDDELEGRRIAFIYYLVPEWKEMDGGLLELFNAVDGQPGTVSETIIPKWNSFVFFEVSPVSFHQVSEVLSTKSRIAVSGWFHGPPLPPNVYIFDPISLGEPTDKEIDISDWINFTYLDGPTQADIQEEFENNSEVLLSDFLNGEKYNEICRALSNPNMKWIKKGPPNRRNIFEAEVNGYIPPIIKECQALFCSEPFLVTISNLTGLHLHPVCEKNAKMAKVFSTIRKWSHGAYTLLHDKSFSQSSSLLSFMYFNCSDWDADYGGFTSFVAEEENEELLRVEPGSNSLALVYITEGTSHFTKYINSKSKKNVYHDIFTLYIENEDERENSNDET